MCKPGNVEAFSFMGREFGGNIRPTRYLEPSHKQRCGRWKLPACCACYWASGGAGESYPRSSHNGHRYFEAGFAGSSAQAGARLANFRGPVMLAFFFGRKPHGKQGCRAIGEAGNLQAITFALPVLFLHCSLVLFGHTANTGGDG